MSAESYPDVLERLFAEFGDRYSLATITEVARGCAEDLRGQVPDSARLEMLERLARQRLSTPSAR
ncbi:MAG: hypothetical protein ABI382_11805 [Nakamurella sp.]